MINFLLFFFYLVVGCQYGLLVFWHLKQTLEANEVIVDINHSCCLKILSEHSGAIGKWMSLKVVLVVCSLCQNTGYFSYIFNSNSIFILFLLANVHVDKEELITDDYDGVVIFRNLKTHSEIKDLF